MNLDLSHGSLANRVLSCTVHDEPEVFTATASCGCRTWTVVPYVALGRCHFCGEALRIAQPEMEVRS